MCDWQTRTRFTVKQVYPFICLNIPFICFKYPSVKPFIVRKIPFVGNAGFTLIELIVAITIVGILAAIAVPSMNRFLESNRLVTLTNDLIADINLARSEAIKRGTQTALCATSGSNCGASTNWGSSGWRVFQDTDNTGTWTTGDALIKDHEAAPLNNTVTAPANLLIFSRLGGMVATVTSQDITICNSRLREKRTLSVNSVGRVSVAQGGC